MITVSHAGMVTALGNDYASSCAAIRAGLSAFDDVPFIIESGPVVAAPARYLTGRALGVELLAELAALAIEDAGAVDLARTSLIVLCLPEPSRADWGESHSNRFLAALQARLGFQLRRRAVIESGPVSATVALMSCRDAIAQDVRLQCLVVGVDSLINAPMLDRLHREQRLKTTGNPDGLIPGEAAACLVVESVHSSARGLKLWGIGFGLESATVRSDEPVLGHGLAQAMKNALADARCTMTEVSFRVSDMTGERYAFADANYALARVLRERKPIFEIIHLMDSLGSTGAAAGACQLAYLKYLYDRGIAPATAAFCESSSDDGQRAVIVAAGHVLDHA